MPSGEDDLIARYFAPIAGAGGLGLLDDAALIAVPEHNELVVTTDGVSQNRHFLDDPPESVARKALRVNLSDLAAKGADPLGFVLTLALPATWNPTAREAFLKPFSRALGEDAKTYRCPLVGGDTIATDGPLTLSVTAFGAVPKGRMVRRTGARPGDLIVASGTIGDAAIGLQLRLREEERARGVSLASLAPAHRNFLLDAYLHPRPRNALAAALRDCAHGAMDISDGFVGDIAKMLRASGVGGVIDAGAAPFSDAARVAIAFDLGLLRVALTGGDDYEIAAAVAPDAWSRFAQRAKEAGVPMTVVGRVTESGDDIRVEPASLADLVGRGSYSHF